MNHLLVKTWTSRNLIDESHSVLAVPLAGELAVLVAAGRSIVLAAGGTGPRPDYVAFFHPLSGLYVDPCYAPPGVRPDDATKGVEPIDEILGDGLDEEFRFLDSSPPVPPNLAIKAAYLEVWDDCVGFRGLARGGLQFESALVPIEALAAGPGRAQPDQPGTHGQ